MKPIRWAVVCLCAILSISQLRGQTGFGNSPATDDDSEVYAAILVSPLIGNVPGRPLIADQTSTFACDESICNGMSIGGCNGLRNSDETPSLRMRIVRRDIPQLEDRTAEEFEQDNRQSISIKHKLPTVSDYHFFSDPDIPKGWKYSTLVYFSSVGFDQAHKQALVNVGVMSAEDAHRSKGVYVLLDKAAGRWSIVGTSAVWELLPSQ